MKKRKKEPVPDVCEWKHGFTSCGGSYLYRVKGACPNCGKTVKALSGEKAAK
jgi:hypothetical protein